MTYQSKRLVLGYLSLHAPSPVQRAKRCSLTHQPDNQISAPSLSRFNHTTPHAPCHILPRISITRPRALLSSLLHDRNQDSLFSQRLQLSPIAAADQPLADRFQPNVCAVAYTIPRKRCDEGRGWNVSFEPRTQSWPCAS